MATDGGDDDRPVTHLADALDSGSPDNNPRKPTTEEIEVLYVEVYDDAPALVGPRRS